MYYLPLPQPHSEFPLFHILANPWIFQSFFSILAIGCEVVPHWCFNLHFFSDYRFWAFLSRTVFHSLHICEIYILIFAQFLMSYNILIEEWEFFVHSGHGLIYVRHMCYKYFSISVGLPFHFLNDVSWRTGVCNFDKIQFTSLLSCVVTAFCVLSKKLFLTPGSQDFLPRFLLKAL